MYNYFKGWIFFNNSELKSFEKRYWIWNIKYGKEKFKIIYNESKLICFGKKNYFMNFLLNL